MIRPVLAIQVPDDNALEVRRLPGRAQAAREVNLSFRIAGPLIGFPVQVGDSVAEGQLLARIDPNDFEVQVRNVSARVAEARAKLTQAEEELMRAEAAAAREAASEIEVITRRSNRDAAAANLEALEAALDEAEDRLGYTELRSPFAGRVVATYVENFEDVQERQAILRVLDDDMIEMVVDVPEAFIGQARAGAKAFAEFDPLEGVILEAVVKEVGTEASEVTRTYPVTLSMAQPEEGARVMPGMTGTAWAASRQVEENAGVLLPFSSLGTDGDGRFVWVIDEERGVVSRRSVTVGEMGARGVSVAGVSAGEWVATAGVDYLSEGQRARIQTERAPG